MALTRFQTKLIIGTFILVAFDIIWFYFHDILTNWWYRVDRAIDFAFPWLRLVMRIY
jgi:hypothetical protein